MGLVIVVHGLKLLFIMQDLCRSGLEPVSPALAGGFLTRITREALHNILSIFMKIPSDSKNNKWSLQKIKKKPKPSNSKRKKSLPQIPSPQNNCYKHIQCLSFQIVLHPYRDIKVTYFGFSSSITVIKLISLKSKSYAIFGFSSTCKSCLYYTVVY